VGVSQRSGGSWYRDSRRVVLDGGEVSSVTLNILRRRGLDEGHRQNPLPAIAALQAEMRETRARELTVAIAELAYIQEKRSTNPDRRALGTTVRYAYAYLFDSRLEPEPRKYDAQFRWACDLYSTALADLIRQADPSTQKGQGDVRLLWYGGEAPVEVARNELHWDLERFDEITLAYDLRVDGLPTPDSRRGLGVPCILEHSLDHQDELDFRSRYLPDEIEVAATMVIRFPDGSSVLDEASAPCLIDIVDPGSRTTLEIEGERVPLEFDVTTPVAAYLAGRRQGRGIPALLNPKQHKRFGSLHTFQPIRRNKLLVLFIHGLASDPFTWLPLYNDLMSNETIRTRCQFAFWFYPTGQPILYSAHELRTALAELRAQFDPKNAHPEDDYTIVCGHSMGGILARLLVTDSEDALWQAAFTKPAEQLDLSAKDRKLVQSCLEFDAQSYIKRVILYSAPLRGSPRATTGLAGWLSGLASMPPEVRKPLDRARRLPESRVQNIRTSIRALSPNNPILGALATLPISPQTTVHTVIGDQDTFAPYASAHLDGAASELVLPVGHSVQQDPRAARETRRIILEHIAAFDAQKKR
jgi:pimeloyl-ACP methyl ester carboxylesterase